MKDEQITLRLPTQLARQVTRRARERGIPTSQIVREALEAYFATASTDVASAWERVQAMIGSVALDHAAIERDGLASQVRANNWRE
jgi:metal-responsive CopG/Arc/MetJ family transcriptional regulator